MGEQVNFYWHGDDELSFLAAARKCSGDLQFLGYTSPTEVFKPLATLPSLGEPGSFHVWLWDRGISAPPITRWISQQRYFTIDSSASEVIQLSRPYERDGCLFRGRLWAEFKGWNASAPQSLSEKSPKFREWFRSLATLIKRDYTKAPEGWYLGPGAKGFLERGGKLGKSDFAPVVKLRKH